ncbi:MaoC/PaaZ C-terminal domain-containing protein [Mariniluteicoccus flavus]
MTEVTMRFTRQQLVKYAGASGDFNPIHFSDHYAAALGLDSVIAHGMLTMGVAMRAATAYAGDPARVVSCSFRFSKPVPVPDDAEGAEVVATAEAGEPADGVTPLTIVARCGDVVVGRGKAEVRDA